MAALFGKKSVQGSLTKSSLTSDLHCENQDDSSSSMTLGLMSSSKSSSRCFKDVPIVQLNAASRSHPQSTPTTNDEYSTFAVQQVSVAYSYPDMVCL